MKTAIFIILLAGAAGFFVKTMIYFVRAAGRGAAEPRPRIDQLVSRLISVGVYFFGQKKVAENGPMHRTSRHHLFIFWGFLIITIATADVIVSGVVPSVSLALLPDFLFLPLKTLIDVFNLIVLTVIGWSFFRRIAVPPRLIPMSLDAALILGAIASLMVTHFLYHGFHSAELYMNTGHYARGAPISNLVASALVPIDIHAAAWGSQIAYWVHVLIVLTFLNYLPYSKHIHLLGALPNIFARNLSNRTLDLPKLDLEDENQWGVGRFEQFSWKSLVDTYACTECARCSNYCPAYNTGKNLSPMQLIHDIRYEMLDRDALYTRRDGLEKQLGVFGGGDSSNSNNSNNNGGHHGEKPADQQHLERELAACKQEIEDMPAMVGGRIAEDTLWACTTCGACQEVCPVFIEHPLKIIQMRQNLILEQEKVPAELARTFRNIERQSNPWGIAGDERMAWAEGLEVPLIDDHPNPEYLLWVGCAGSFDNRIIKQTKAMVKVLNAARVNYAVLGHQEGCTGDPARRAGNELLFQMQAEANVETLNATGVKKVITSCPHCLHTLRHDYPQFGGNYEVIHHTQLIAHLLESGDLVPELGSVKSITYHDSCYLGRWNREFEAPRSILASLPIDRVVEMKRNKRHGFCCGAGGARMFMEEESPRVNDNRAQEIIDTDVEAVAVACPFCNIMLTDGMKSFDKEDDIRVLDVAELVASTIPDVPIGALVRRKSPPEAVNADDAG